MTAVTPCSAARRRRLDPFGPLGFGGASLGNMFDAIDDQTADDTLSAAWASGVRHFDTAPVYGRGLGELRFGHFLRRQPRADYQVSTKVGRIVRASFTPSSSQVDTSQGPGAAETSIFTEALPFRVDVDYGYDAALRSVEGSMIRLGLDFLDIVYVHDLGSDHLGDEWRRHFTVAESGAFRALAELRDQGVIGAWGLGNNVLAPQILAMEHADPDILHISGRYTLLDQTALDDLLPRAHEAGIPVVIGGPYNSGILAGSHRYDYHAASPDLLAARDRISTLCAEFDVDIRSVALQFATAHPAVAMVMPGTKHPRFAAENAERMTDPIPEGLWSALASAGCISPESPIPQLV
ncbi:aldo/keto reductase [Subtercola frigoramans]|uniref:D-threo-aldose 1-dehydrogenase n=1 Tax=Subtercola frigoramans TaxID=120298 RepID=A0ABS2L9C1_9MICO|nr:aldo/keto reductase [Subtercola frigoramans]MBM7473669.1 D-threo-aldose 1-dehydrogenase [Subtercola frigoramans]